MKKILVFVFVLGMTQFAQAQQIERVKITDIEKMMADTSNGLLVLNFWATFCKPCVEEIPHFIKTANKYKDRGLKLLLVSLDLPAQYPVKLKAFAKKHQFNAPLAWLDESNADYFCPKIDSNWSGSIPATLIINTKTGYRKFFEEEVNAADLEKAVVEGLGG